MRLAAYRIVVTGGAGFLGRFVRQELLERGVPAANVMVPRRAQYDLTQEAAVAGMYEDMRPDVVIHLAAEVGGIGANRSSPGRFFYANMAMGLHLIEHARRRGVTKFVQVGTVCAYPKMTVVPFREEDIWTGYPEETNAPYGIAKKALLTMLEAYRQQYGLCGIYLLPVNLYGPGDNFEMKTSHVIPAMIRKFETARKEERDEVTLWGTGRSSREFLYVQDAARGIAMATEQYDGPLPVNLGVGQEITIAELAGKIALLIGYRGKILWDASYPDGQPRRCLDTSRAKALFGFSATIDLDEGLRRTVQWWRQTDPKHLPPG